MDRDENAKTMIFGAGPVTAIGIVRGANKVVAQMARALGINPRTMAHWVAPDPIA